MKMITKEHIDKKEDKSAESQNSTIDSTGAMHVGGSKDLLVVLLPVFIM